MRNFKLTLEYDGTDFHGWQRQPGLRTIQGTMEAALAEIFEREVQVNGAGRTDTGVHALGQVASFAVETRMTPEQVGKAISTKLPEDIHVYRVDEVDLNFHARFSAKSRRYTYYVRTEPTAIWRRFAHVVTFPLDTDAMNRGAAYLVGDKDFASFTPNRGGGLPTRCIVMSCKVERHDEIVSVTIEADHFIHNMVRAIVGTLIDVGRDRFKPEHVNEVLVKTDRAAAGPTIPPNGLFLMEVVYEE
jgi:tRNA pseudouridine38-40 synthase